MTRGFLALGGNLGDRRASLQAAVDALPARGVAPQRSSSVYATEAVGGPAGQPDYLNAALEVETTLTPLALLEVMKAIERELGRAEPGEPGYVHHGPRPIDLDILLLGEQTVDAERPARPPQRLVIPHRALTGRRFVLVPLLELRLDLALPDGTVLADALLALPLDEDVRRDGPPLRTA